MLFCLFGSTFVGSHSVAISANYITLLNFIQNSPCCHSVNTVQFVFFGLSFSMIEVHYVERILNATVGTGARFHLPHQFSALHIGTNIPIKVLAFIVAIVITR